MTELLIEQVNEKPMAVIREIFDRTDMKSVKENAWVWLKTALKDNNNHDCTASEAFDLIDLYNDLVALSELLYLHLRIDGSKFVKSHHANFIIHKSRHQISSIEGFFQKHPIKKLRYNLWRWLDMGMCKEKSIYDNWLDRSNLLCLYQHLSWLVEAAFVIHTQELPPEMWQGQKDCA